MEQMSPHLATSGRTGLRCTGTEDEGAARVRSTVTPSEVSTGLSGDESESAIPSTRSMYVAAGRRASAYLEAGRKERGSRAGGSDTNLLRPSTITRHFLTLECPDTTPER